MTPYFSWIALSGSERRGKFSSCFSANFSWLLIESRLMPRIVAPLRLNLAFRSRKAWASFVQPEVLSFG
jgi:hypothetical protein